MVANEHQVEFLTPLQVARILGRSRTSVYRYIRLYNLPAYQLPGSGQYVIRRQDLFAWLRGEIEEDEDD